jgi:hypothetical protein
VCVCVCVCVLFSVSLFLPPSLSVYLSPSFSLSLCVHAFQPLFALMDLMLDYTAKNEMDALVVARGTSFASVPVLEHAEAPTSPASPLRTLRTSPRPTGATVRGAPGFARAAISTEDGAAAAAGGASIENDDHGGGGVGGGAAALLAGGVPLFEQHSKVRGRRLPACTAVGSGAAATTLASPEQQITAGSDMHDEAFPAENPGAFPCSPTHRTACLSLWVPLCAWLCG